MRCTDVTCTGFCHAAACKRPAIAGIGPALIAGSPQIAPEGKTRGVDCCGPTGAAATVARVADWAGREGGAAADENTGALRQAQRRSPGGHLSREGPESRRGCLRPDTWRVRSKPKGREPRTEYQPRTGQQGSRRSGMVAGGKVWVVTLAHRAPQGNDGWVFAGIKQTRKF